MSGATPWYVIPGDNGKPVQVMTGATIDDARTDLLLEGKYFMDRSLASLSGGVSFEKDYLAINGGLGGQIDFNEKNTTLSGGLGVSIDSIDPTDTAEFPLRPNHENKQNYSGFLGVSQVLRRNIAVQSTLTYALGNGYLSDPVQAGARGGRARRRQPARPAQPDLVAQPLPPSLLVARTEPSTPTTSSTGTIGTSPRTRSKSPGTNRSSRRSA